MSLSGYDIAATVEYGIAIPLLLVLSIFSLVGVRRRNDPLRLPFLWLKLAIPLMIMYVNSHVRQCCTSAKLTPYSVAQLCRP
jgi:hypothetical protein